MAKEQRTHPRIKVPMKVSLRFSETGDLLAVTRDISDNGIFLLLDQETMPKIGDIVRVQVQGVGG
ncbi:MAG: PilZ domain-containing protein, partial [Pseudomonadales bacterium]|nr:PilZ domain-containing protein [Pseudomonadales bacterium]